MKWEMFLILAFTPGPLNSRRDTFKVYLKPILGMCFFWMCFLGCAPRYEIWSIEQKLWEYPFKPPSDTPRSRWGPGVGRRWWLEQGVEKDSTANCHLGEMTTTLNKFNASVISFEHFSLVILWKTQQQWSCCDSVLWYYSRWISNNDRHNYHDGSAPINSIF